MSNFIRALNSYQETFPGISYTDVYTHDDEVVRPNSDDTGSSSLHGGGGRITNVAVQDICPADSSDHDLLGTVDAVAYELAMDALTHDGPADKSRIPITTCAQPYMPGINPATGPAAGLQALYDDETSTGPETPSEPPLACYVFASCRIAGPHSIALPVSPLITHRCGHIGRVGPQRITSRRTSCRTARRVARAHSHRIHRGQTCDLRHRSCRVLGWRCTRRFFGNSGTKVHCTRGVRGIRFIYGT